MKMVGFKPNDKLLIAKRGFCYGETVMVKSKAWIDDVLPGTNVFGAVDPDTYNKYRFPENLEEDPPFVDYIKTRLFSVFQKTNADSNCSPIYGKNDVLSRQLTWNRKIYPNQTQDAKNLFARNFFRYVEPTYLVTLPRESGGLNIGTPPPLEDWDEDIINGFLLIHHADIPKHIKFKVAHLMRMFIARKTSTRGYDLSFDANYLDKWFDNFGPILEFNAVEKYRVMKGITKETWDKIPYYIKRLRIEECFYSWEEVFDSFSIMMKDSSQSTWLKSTGIGRGYVQDTQEVKGNLRAH